jgi:protein subunit release factor B
MNSLLARCFGKYVLPLSEVRFQYSRSSGPGGQHVNKTESKVEGRISTEAFKQFPDHVYKQLVAKYSNRINKCGDLIVTSQSILINSS